MADPIRQYQQALRRRAQAYEAATELIAGVRYAATLAEDWQRMEISHPDFAGPRDSSMPLDPAEWPAIESLVSVLSDWHRADRAVARAWAKLPSEDREGIRAPSD